MAYTRRTFRRDLSGSWNKIRKKMKQTWGGYRKSGFDPFRSFLPLTLMIASIFFFVAVKIPFFLGRLILKT